MQIPQLRAFCAVAQSGSISTAARVLNKVPSSITVRIQQLEEDLKQQLFLRERKRMSLSPAGRQLLEHAQRILDLTDGTRALMRDEEISGSLTVGALDVVLVDYMPRVIGYMRQRHRGIHLNVRHQASEDLVAHIADGSLDIALTEGPISSKALRSRIAFVDEMLLVTDPGHRDVVTPTDLECAELYGFRHDCSFRFRMDRWLASGGRSDLPVIEIESYHTMLACVSAGMGAAWMLRSILKTLPGHNQVKAHSLGDHGRTEIHFVWRDGHLSRNAELFMDASTTV
ncbi:LysR family transcriptional regulator [Novosphingobium profundi]|uniref:LysR family transcriptional regulator n=1 Tax=Novosphingobium profundi TaxID=1774954 RepID=UPI001BD99B82|nr:LysR family transcriptional regulator [Novosphingobium profundi]MBT0667443.1 LysR family transcriptional regulator [Novosphingobium profundi]